MGAKEDGVVLWIGHWTMSSEAWLLIPFLTQTCCVTFRKSLCLFEPSFPVLVLFLTCLQCLVQQGSWLGTLQRCLHCSWEQASQLGQIDLCKQGSSQHVKNGSRDIAALVGTLASHLSSVLKGWVGLRARVSMSALLLLACQPTRAGGSLPTVVQAYPMYYSTTNKYQQCLRVIGMSPLVLY